MAVDEQRVPIAGATGYLGGFSAREFKSRGHFARALARSPGKLDSMKDQLDDIVNAETTVPGSLTQVCDGIDVVFSSVGITKQKGRLTFRDADCQGNKNLLDALEGERQELDVGGPEVYTWRKIAELAFAALEKPAKISAIPTWTAKGAVGAARIFNRHQGELLAFFTEVATSDVVAPAVGSRTLKAHCEELAESLGRGI